MARPVGGKAESSCLDGYVFILRFQLLAEAEQSAEIRTNTSLPREQHFTFEYDVGVWSMGSVQALKDRDDGGKDFHAEMLQPSVRGILP